MGSAPGRVVLVRDRSRQDEAAAQPERGNADFEKANSAPWRSTQSSASEGSRPFDAFGGTSRSAVAKAVVEKGDRRRLSEGSLSIPRGAHGRPSLSAPGSGAVTRSRSPMSRPKIPKSYFGKNTSAALTRGSSALTLKRSPR